MTFILFGEIDIVHLGREVQPSKLRIWGTIYTRSQ